MATAVATKPTGVTEDDEEWLYGDSGNKEPAAPGTGSEEKLPPHTEATENAENSQPKEENDDDDDDSDEDNVQVTIGEISAFPVTSTGSNLFKPSGTYQKQPVTAGSGQKGAVTTQATKGVDVDGEGTVNGIPLYEFSLDTLRDEDKPWRKPGADITDYFNYGFNEDTWRKYCQKQNKTRAENGVAIPKAFGSVGFGTTVKVESTDSHAGQTYVAKTYTPSIQQPTAIAVLGSTTASRRPIEESMNDVQQIGTLSSDTSKPSDVPPVLPPVGMPPPDYSVPPPGMPPMPPGFSPAVPPPGMNVPPPNMFGHPPPIPPPFFPPNVPPPNSTAYPDRPPYTYDNTPSANSYSESKSNWDRDRDSYRERDRDRDRDRYDYKRDRSPGSGFSSDSGDDYRYSRSSKDYSRDYERDYYRSRELERSRSDRDRSRSRDRDRRHRDRDRDRDDKKSKRKIKDEPDDSDYYKSSSSSSKHKKSKRSKRDKDDESDKQIDDGKGAP